MSKTLLKIETRSYQSQFEKISDNLLFLKRTHRYPIGFETIDTYGDFNILAFANLENGSVELKNNNQSLSLNGNIALFVPKYSIIQWKIHTPLLQWSAFVTNQKLSTEGKPVVIFDPPSIKPKSVEDLKCIIENTTRFHHVKELMPIGSDLIAYKIKEQLDLRHTEDIEIKEISELFKLTLSQTTKIFAKTFGLTPVEYRSKVRIFNSMFNLLISKDSTDVTEIAYESGFSDLSRFNKQFKKITSTTPSKFKFR
jgi:AraC-like DNA-binding protein